MIGKELKKRWELPEYKKLYSEVLNCLKKKKDLSKIDGIEYIDGYIDLRGLPLICDPVNHSVTFCRLNLHKVDFSFSELYLYNFENSNFDSCIFNMSKFDQTETTTSNFKNCQFKSVLLKDSYWGKNGALTVDCGSFIDCDFTGSKIKNTFFDWALVKGCTFLDCEISSCHFGATRFIDCIFGGKIRKTFFRGYPTVKVRPLLYPLFKYDVKDYYNPMQNIDFTQVTFDDVPFYNNIDLSDCKFPKNGRYMILPNSMDKFRKLKLDPKFMENGYQASLEELILALNYGASAVIDRYTFIERSFIEDFYGKEFADDFFNVFQEYVVN